MESHLLESFIAIRHHIHQHPELEGDTIQTAQLVADHLSAYGYKVHRNIGGHGVVAVLKKGKDGKRLGIRADMDALPMQEKNHFSYVSKIEGKMHACGHDGHTTILLAAAKLIAENISFNGTLNLIFQPAEETLSGARSMIEDGLFEKFPCDAVYALHNMPGIPIGTIAVQEGTMMAALQKVVCTIKGRGGHGGIPELTHDPIPAAATFIQALQTIKSRNLGVQEYAVISVGSIHAGTAYNIIPNEAVIQISIRTDTEAVMEKITERLDQIAQGIELSFNVKIDLDLDYLVPPVNNSRAETAILTQALTAHNTGLEVQPLSQKFMTSEDFALMMDVVPWCYFFLGNGEGAFQGCSIHNAYYDFNDENILLGANCWMALVETYLK